MKSNGSEADPGRLAIDNLVKTFFEVFTTTGQQQPDWTIIDKVCIPEAIIIKINAAEEVIYNLTSFVEPRRKILTDGTLKSFQEVEIESETKIIGSMAQRFSRYQKSGYLNDTYFKEYGNKFFQFIKTKEGWKINSLIWEDE
jgi:hypothetical protein